MAHWKSVVLLVNLLIALISAQPVKEPEVTPSADITTDTESGSGKEVLEIEDQVPNEESAFTLLRRLDGEKEQNSKLSEAEEEQHESRKLSKRNLDAPILSRQIRSPQFQGDDFGTQGGYYVYRPIFRYGVQTLKKKRKRFFPSPLLSG